MDTQCCAPAEVLIFTCSGASNVGQVANQAALDLQQEGVGRMLCLAGIGGHVSGMIASARAGNRLLGIDGCPIACAKKTMEHAGLPLNDYLVITELGFEKKAYSGAVEQEMLDKVKDELKRQIGSLKENA